MANANDELWAEIFAPEPSCCEQTKKDDPGARYCSVCCHEFCVFNLSTLRLKRASRHNFCRVCQDNGLRCTSVWCTTCGVKLVGPPTLEELKLATEARL